MQQTEQLAIEKNWLGRKGLQFLESLTNEEKLTCNMLEGQLEILTKNLGHSLMIPSNYCNSAS